MADLDFLKSDNATSSDNLSFLSEKNSTTDPLSFLKEEQEIEIFGVPQKELEEGGDKVGRILSTVKDDLVKLYKGPDDDFGVPEGAKIAGSKEELDFFGFNTEQFPTTEILGTEIIDYKTVWNESDSVKDFSSKVGKRLGKIIVGDIWTAGDFALKTTFAPIQTIISGFGQTAEEIVLDTIGEEGFTELEKKIFNSDTMKASDIKEGIEEFAHIALADTISKAPKIKEKQYFNQLAKEQGLEVKVPLPVSKEVAKEEVKTKIEPFLEPVKENISEVLSNEISIKTGQNKNVLKDQIKLKLDETQKIIKDKENKPAYIDDVVQMSYRASWNPAKNYQKEIGGEVLAQKGSPKKVLTRQEVLSNFIGDLNVPVAQGRIKSKNVLGQFFPRYEEVRTKKKYDLNTASHEIGHFIEKRFPEITKKFDEPIIKEELTSISYDKNQPVPHEGFAEFVRLYLNAPEVAQRLTPNFYKWFDGKVRNNEFVTNINGKQTSIKNAVVNAQNQFSQYWKQSDLQRLESKIGYTEAIDSKLGTWGERFRSNYIDALQGIQRMERDLGATDTVIYKRASGLRQGDSIVTGAIDYGIPIAKYDLKTKEYVISFDKKMSLRKALDPVAFEIDNFIKYSVARSSKELMSQGREKLITAREIETGLKLETPKLKKAFDDVQIWQKGIADFAQNYGKLFTPKQRSQWRRTEYLPYHRVNSGKQGSIKFAQRPSEFTGIKALTGGQENLRPILENIVGNARMLIQESVKNRLKLDLIDFVNLNSKKGSGRYIVSRKPVESKGKDLAITKTIKDQLADNLEAMLPENISLRDIKGGKEFMDMIDLAWDQIGPITKVITINKRPKGFDKLLPVVENGKVKYYEILDPLLYRAIIGLDKQSPIFHGVGNLLTMPKKIGQATITLVPDFIVANFTRDTIGSFIYSQSGHKLLLSAIDGIKTRIAKDPYYMEWLANGGDLGSYYIAEGAFRQSIEKFYTNKGINYKQVADTPRKFLNLLETLGAVVESANRLGEYKLSRKRGESVTESIYRSKEISVDFGKRGAYEGFTGQTLRFLNETVLFLRPAILGLDRFYRGVAKDPNRVKIAIKMGLLATTSMALALHNSRNPMYQALEDWDKDTNWHIFIPNERWLRFVAQNGRLPHNSYEEAIGYNPQDGSFNPYYFHWRMPKVWEVGSVASIAERVGLSTADGTLLTKKSGEDFKRIFLSNFRLNPIPQFARPPVELMMNKTFFTGRPIETAYDKSIAPELRGAGRTSRTIRYIGDKLDLSPPQLEALIRGYFNSFATYGLLMGDQFFFNDSEDLSIKNYPVIRRFAKEQPLRSTKYVTQAYEELEEISMVLKSARESIKRFDKDNAYKFILDERVKFKGLVNATKKKLTDYNRLIQTVDNTKTLSQLQELSKIIGKETGKKNYVQSLKDQNIWNDLGALKKYVKDDLYMIRNKIAEKFVKIIEQEKVK